MIKFLDYPNIQDTSQFILKHSQPTFELYAFEEDNQNKFQILQFMTSNNWNTGMTQDNLKKNIYVEKLASLIYPNGFCSFFKIKSLIAFVFWKFLKEVAKNVWK